MNIMGDFDLFDLNSQYTKFFFQILEENQKDLIDDLCAKNNINFSDFEIDIDKVLISLKKK
jgi:hypothetical protein